MNEPLMVAVYKHAVFDDAAGKIQTVEGCECFSKEEEIRNGSACRELPDGSRGNVAFGFRLVRGLRGVEG